MAALATAAAAAEQESHAPIPVSIVTCGVTDAYWWLRNVSDPDEWHVVDLRGLLTDPAHELEWQEDFRFERTVRVVVGQQNFPEVIASIVKVVNGTSDVHQNQTNKVLVHCQTGWHMASVSGKILESTLNSILVHGQRAFNAQQFAIHDILNNSEYECRLKDAEEWSRSSWEVMKVVDKREDLWGYAACMGSRASGTQFSHLVGLIDEMFGRFNPEIEGRREEPLQHPCVEGRVPEQGNASLQHPGTKGQVPEQRSASLQPLQPPDIVGQVPTLRKATLQPRPPSVPPPSVSVVPPPPPPAPRRNGRSMPSSHSADMADEVKSPADEPEHARPEWATFDNDVKVWWELLDFFEVDEPARQSLFALAQYGEEGYYHANTLVSKMIKKRGDGRGFDNSSGFIHSSVLNARHSMASNYADVKPRKRRR